MPCPTYIDELMSLKLDSLIDAEGDRLLEEHLSTCTDCSVLWVAMKQADGVLWASALNPLPVPSDFQMKVMTRIAVLQPVHSAALETGPFAQPGIGLAISMAATRRLDELPTGYLAIAEWQHRVASYIRGMAAVGLALAGTVGLLLALLLSDTIKVSGPAADAVGVVRTFFQAIDTWISSLFVNLGPGIIGVGTFMVGVLLLVGWQVVSGYHRSAFENRGNTGALEALA